MNKTSDFSFGDKSVAGGYADVLVPILFEPWATSLVEMYRPWEGKQVLDLATGTGIVAQLLAREVTTSGSVIGMDMNQEMLDVAATLAESLSNLSFALCPAEKLDCPDNSFDNVVCQQGFQFFADRTASAKEIHRVLRDGGVAILSVWRPVSECHFFGAICKSLAAVDEGEISDMMRAPFDFMPSSELVGIFESAGFSTVNVRREQRDLVINGGIEQAIEVAYSTPIGPKLAALPKDTQDRFRDALTNNIRDLDGDGITMGQMAADILTAIK